MCLLRQFNIRVFSRDNSSSLALSERAQERLRSADEASWSGLQMNADLVTAVFFSMAMATAGAFLLTFTSIVFLALGYRSDMMKARRGRFPPVQRFFDLPAPTAATMFVGSQTYGLLAGWVVYLLGLFTIFFALSWPPLRSYLVASTWLTLLVALALWVGARLFTYVAGCLPFSPIRLKEGYIPGTKLVANRAWWGYFEFLAIFIHMGAAAFGTLMHFILAFLRQFMRVSRLDLATFAGGSRHLSDPGHAGYKAMLMTDHMLNSPVINAAVLTLERELQRRRFFREVRLSSSHLPSPAASLSPNIDTPSSRFLGSLIKTLNPCFLLISLYVSLPFAACLSSDE